MPWPATRAAWEELADDLLEGVARYRSPLGARFDLPGPRPSSRGTRMDGLEGFARSFLLAAFRMAHAPGGRRGLLAARYREGLLAGTDPLGPEAWPAIRADGQAMVEAASVAIALFETRAWLWDGLAPVERAQVTRYLSAITAHPLSLNNWFLFRVMVVTALVELGEPVDITAADEALATIDLMYRGEGWYQDGSAVLGTQYDYYTGWAFHLYTLMWARMRGDRVDPARAAGYRSRARHYRRTLVATIGADGGPLHQGRSLVYRAAMLAPLWALHLGPQATDPATAAEDRRAVDAVMGHFVDRGAVQDGLLSLGWHREFEPMTQAYSGPASPLWMSKGFLGLLLPPAHPVWTVDPGLLPIEREEVEARFDVPGWIAHGETSDGIVAIANVGTARDTDPGDPHYDRLAFSTATAPWFSGASRPDPDTDEPLVVDNWVGYLTPYGPTSMGRVARIADSKRMAALIETYAPEPHPERTGRMRLRPVPPIRRSSSVRGRWELRRFDVVGHESLAIATSGWCVSGDDVTASAGPGWVAATTDTGLSSVLVVLGTNLSIPSETQEGVVLSVETRSATAFGPHSLLPVACWPVPAPGVVPGTSTIAVAVALCRGTRPADAVAALRAPG